MIIPNFLWLPKFPPPPGNLVNYNLSGIPDFRAQFAQRLSQFQDWREPRENLQIEGIPPMQITGPPEASHPLEILSRDDSLQSQISQGSLNSSGTQVRATRRKLEHPQVQLPNLGVLQQSIQWANPREEDMGEREATRVHTPPQSQKRYSHWGEGLITLVLDCWNRIRPSTR